MSHITVRLKDGTSREFKEENRPGGSYRNSVKFDVGFVVVTDVWGKRTAIPAEDVAEVVDEPDMRGRW